MGVLVEEDRPCLLSRYTRSSRKNVNNITAGLVYDGGASREECVLATSAMAIR